MLYLYLVQISLLSKISSLNELKMAYFFVFINNFLKFNNYVTQLFLLLDLSI